jgi:hypothetical protein
VIELSEFTVKLVAGTSPNETALASVKPVPVTVTVLPPTLSPDPGDTPVTAGTGRYVYWSAAEIAVVAPSQVKAVTSTVPAEPAGTVAVSCVSESTVKLEAGTEPKSTVVTPGEPKMFWKPVPVMVTVFPPAVGPTAGETPVTVGSAT